MIKTRFPAICAILLAAASLTGCVGKAVDTTVTAGGFLMDTYVTVTAYGASKNGQELLNEALDYMAELEGQFNRTYIDGDVWRINNADAGDIVSVSADVISLLLIAEECGEISGGLFNAAIGAVSELWDFKTGTAPPDSEAITAALASVSDGVISIDRENNMVRVEKSGVKLDLGGIAKGYIAGQVSRFLGQNGVVTAVIDAGGDIYLLGSKPKGTWNISIMDPYGGGGSLGILQIEPDDSRRAVVTSGSYQRSFVYEGKLYHHILDPATGYPRQSDLVSVTVIAADAAWADALATITFMLGSEAGYRFVESYENVEAVFALDNGDIMVTSGIENELGVVFIKQ